MTYASGIKKPSGHSVYNSLSENTEMFSEWVFLDQL